MHIAYINIDMAVDMYLLKHLDAFARCKTLAAASKELRLTQPTLTRSMQKLENELGASLFEREGKRIRLNEKGLLVSEYATKILSLETEMCQQLSAMEKQQRIFSFGSVSPGPIRELVPRFVGCFHEKTIQYEIQDADVLIRGIKDGTYQMIALNFPIDDGDLYCKRVFSERIYYCFAPSEHPVSTDGVHFRDINGRSVLMPVGCGFWEKIIDDNMPDSTIIMQEGNEIVNLIAERSDLAAFSSDIAIKHNIVRPGRVMLPILDDAAKADYYCICRADDDLKGVINGLYMG